MVKRGRKSIFDKLFKTNPQIFREHLFTPEVKKLIYDRVRLRCKKKFEGQSPTKNAIRDCISSNLYAECWEYQMRVSGAKKPESYGNEEPSEDTTPEQQIDDALEYLSQREENHLNEPVAPERPRRDGIEFGRKMPKLDFWGDDGDREEDKITELEQNFNRSVREGFGLDGDPKKSVFCRRCGCNPCQCRTEDEYY